MAKKNYYKMLGVSRTASPEEISAAKNRLAKKYHPDANMKNGIDTTRKMQQILEAYRILSDPKKRASYDRKVFGKPSAGADRNFDLFNLHNMEETAPVTGTPFVNYWRAADSLYDITLESEQLFKEKNKEQAADRLSDLSSQALRYAITLREAEIPEKYWLPPIMDWLLFTWYKNRNLPVSYLLKVYDDYSKKELRLHIMYCKHHYWRIQYERFKYSKLWMRMRRTRQIRRGLWMQRMQLWMQ